MPTANKALVQRYVEAWNMGNLALIGKDRDTWGASDERLSHNMDLLAIKSGGEDDAFSTWFGRKFIHWFHHILGHRMTSQRRGRPPRGDREVDEGSLRAR